MPGDEHVIDVSSQRAHLSLSQERLRVRIDEREDTLVPLKDVAICIFADQRTTCTGGLLAGLMRHGGAFIVCDDTQTPVGTMLPLGANNEQTKRVRAQCAAAQPTLKRTWKHVVQAKVRAQAHTLRLHTGDDAGLWLLAQRVRSGDPENIESTAAQRYWPRLFGDPAFRRRRDLDDHNRCLNYGYAVLRAAVARALCAAGLHPSISIHHHGRNNFWALADDLMEPYRPLVDDEVADILGHHEKDDPLGPEIKQRLIGVLHPRLWGSVDGRDEHRTVVDWIGRTASSVARIFLSENPRAHMVFYPQGLWHAPPKP